MPSPKQMEKLLDGVAAKAHHIEVSIEPRLYSDAAGL
jgi:hypothetical protein